jgi:hypothetical protein
MTIFETLNYDYELINGVNNILVVKQKNSCLA